MIRAMNKLFTSHSAALTVFSVGALLHASVSLALDGTVIDTSTQKPLADATVTFGTTLATTDADGRYHLDDELLKNAATESRIFARAIGYNRTSSPIEIDATTNAKSVAPLQLSPLRVNGLYLSFYGIGDKTLRTSALSLFKDTQLNAVVIDVKGDRAMIPYRSDIPLANAIGARKITTVGDMRGRINEMHEQGIYVIARIVAFKDDLLAKAKPEWAIHKNDGTLFRDLEGLNWIDASRKEAWQYNIDIAVEAAQLGFDEIQFDYVRFPDRLGLVFSVENNQQNRVAAISGFLKSARDQLTPYNVFLSADIFGYVPWNYDDTAIGQTLDGVLSAVDYACPMLYPSGFQFGIPQSRNPVADPYKIVYHSLDQAIRRSKVSPLRFRPWLQAFRDYAFDKRAFSATEIESQINAANKAGASGWLLWNPSNTYTTAGIPVKLPTVKVDAAL